MAKNLIIDIGNSRVKLYVMDHGVVIYDSVSEFLTKEMMIGVYDRCGRIDGAIVSSTRGGEGEAHYKTMLSEFVDRVVVLDHTTPIPLINCYGTPETLGMDRLAAAIGAWSIVPGEEILIFDFGTALTIDRVSRKGEFLGGNISPGVGMRFEAMHRFTGKLPLVGADEILGGEQLFGRSTREAIWNGVMYGVELEIQGYISQFDGAKLFFTGQDAKYFAKCRENAIFVDYLLVAKGLERIIEYNAKKSNL